MPHDLDIAIVGAGAAGLMAAIFAGRTALPKPPTALRIAALDGAKKLGAKILVSGGGRCNVTHDVVHPHDFAGSNRYQITKVLRSFDVPQTVAFFQELGVELKREDTGKLFPITDKAQTVLTALLDATTSAGAQTWSDHRVTGVERTNDGFAIHTSEREISSRLLILATGGKSLPKTGSDGGGYALAKALGHSVTDTWPSLVPLVLEEKHWLTELAGITVETELRLAAASGKIIQRQRGSMLFTHMGVSGPAPMDISRHWIAAYRDDPAVRLTANLLPDQTLESLEKRVLDETKSRPRSTVAALVRGWLPERLSDALMRRGAVIDPATPLSQLSKESRRNLIRAMTALPLPIVRDRGFLFAEATAGGVPLSEVDTATMASRKCPGLFLCGEILDVDGRIGGYNFQWAWASGRLAGIHAARAALGS